MNSGKQRRWVALALWLVGMVLLCGSCGLVPRGQQRVPQRAALVLRHVWAHDFYGNKTLWGSSGLEVGTTTALSNGLLVTPLADGRVVAVQMATGDVAWEQRYAAPVRAAGASVGQTLFLGGGDGWLRALEASSGRELWAFDTGTAVEAAPAVAEDLVVVVNAGNRVHAVNRRTGAFVWRKERARINDFTLMGQATPLIDGDRVYVGFSDGTVTAYALQDGALLWTRDLAVGLNRFRDVDGSPYLFGDRLYVASAMGGVYALDPESGETLWQQKIEGVCAFHGYGTAVYFTSSQGVYCVAAEDGAILWRNVVLEDALLSPVTVGQRYVYVGVQRLGLALLDRVSGKTVSLLDMGSGFTSSPRLIDGALFVLSNRGLLYRLEVEDQPLL